MTIGKSLPDFQSIIRPENEIELQIIQHPDWQIGAVWGKPRKGHPEGAVIRHIRDVLDNVDQLQINPESRKRLRWVTLIHDTFKYQEVIGFPRDWSKHHAVFARKFAETLISDALTLDLIELHDEAYYAWRTQTLPFGKSRSDKRLLKLNNRIDPHLDLYHWFFVCDTQTGNKTQAPILWFENQFPHLNPVPWAS